MSLYNMLFGVDKLAPILLKTLNLDPAEVPRFRDCYLDVKRKCIVVHTRTGGGNREAYWEENEALQNHPQYFSDVDSDLDPTYADFSFSFPPDFADDFTALCGRVETHIPSEKWRALFASFEEKK